jgi:cell division protein FtsQ
VDGATSLFATLDDDWRGDVHERHLPQPANPDQSRFMALDAEPDAQFLRAQKRVPVRRGPITRKAANRLKQVLVAIAILVGAAVAAIWLYRYAQMAPRFRVESSEQVAIEGTQNVTRTQVLDVFGSDIGRNLFFIPIEDRKRQVERLPWVQSAAVMRLLPNQIRVAVEERTPVAFAQVGPRILLIDREGVLLDSPAIGKAKYSFPVIVGMAEAEPLSTRAARMKIYSRVIADLDSGGARYSEDVSEVDLRDPEDVRITVSDDDGPVLVHLGDSNFLERYKTYISHLQGWRQQYHKIESVDLRFDRQVIVHPDPALASAATSSIVQAQRSARPAASHAPRSTWKAQHKPAQKSAIGTHGQSTAQRIDRH